MSLFPSGFFWFLSLPPSSPSLVPSLPLSLSLPPTLTILHQSKHVLFVCFFIQVWLLQIGAGNPTNFLLALNQPPSYRQNTNKLTWVVDWIYVYLLLPLSMCALTMGQWSCAINDYANFYYLTDLWPELAPGHRSQLISDLPPLLQTWQSRSAPQKDSLWGGEEKGLERWLV